MKTIISLTSIPSRFKHIDKTLNSLLGQDIEIDKVVLYLPKHYKRFDIKLDKLPCVPKGITTKFSDIDYGPATKILPAIKDFMDKDVRIIFCDDDRIYPNNFVSSLISASKSRPNDVISLEGRDIKDISKFNWQGKNFPRSTIINKNFLYRLKRALSFGIWKPQKNSQAGYADTFAGFGGVLVYPKFFNSNFFQIPEECWMNDDIWISGQLEINKIKIWVTEAKQTSGASQNQGKNALGAETHHDKTRVNVNNTAIKYLRETYGIWKD
tara:strand:+ start:373 stop:1176 length:804 start_codon:yes stop_codon:yes gene_type:complete